MNRIQTVEVIVRPSTGEPKRVAVDLCEILHNFVEPLPSGHDDPLSPGAMREAAEAKKSRRALAADIGRVLAEAIVKAWESRDPVKGYRPDES